MHTRIMHYDIITLAQRQQDSDGEEYTTLLAL